MTESTATVHGCHTNLCNAGEKRTWSEYTTFGSTLIANDSGGTLTANDSCPYCAGYSGCKQVRQVLVARPGQKPCAWVSFDVLRSNLLSWHGYALMAATRREDSVLTPEHSSETAE